MPKEDGAFAQRNKAALKAVSPLFEDLNKSWERIEEFFRKQGILRSVQIPYASDEDGYGQPVAEYLIGLQKRRGEWRICYGEFWYANPTGEADWTPITEAGIEVRVKLLNHVTELFATLVKSNEEFVPELEQAVAMSHAVLEELTAIKTK